MENIYIVYKEQRYHPFKIMVIYGRRRNIEDRIRSKGYIVSFAFTMKTLIKTQNMTFNDFIVRYRRHDIEYYNIIKSIDINKEYQFYLEKDVPLIKMECKHKLLKVKHIKEIPINFNYVCIKCGKKFDEI